MKTTWKGSPNYTAGRGGHTIDHITLHIMAGYLAGTDATFANPAVQTSAHYGIGADGTIHQYVDEKNTAWSDGNALSNATGISIEHEGGIPQAKCTRACMDASAQLCADIARRYGWKKLEHINSDKGNIYLHREVYGSTHTTCPDLAPNGLDVNYVIKKANEILGNKQANNIVESEKKMGTTHIVFGVDNSLDIYIANIMAGTYQKMSNPNVLKTRIYVLQKCGAKVKSWADVTGGSKGRSGYGTVKAVDIAAFGLEIK